MAKRFLGKVVAGVALGGASLLIGAPGVALANDGHKEEPDEIYTQPEWVKPDQKIKIIETCTEEQDEPWAWSEVTGEVDLVLKKHGDKWYGNTESWHEDGQGWQENGGSWQENGDNRHENRDNRHENRDNRHENRDNRHENRDNRGENRDNRGEYGEQGPMSQEPNNGGWGGSDDAKKDEEVKKDEHAKKDDPKKDEEAKKDDAKKDEHAKKDDAKKDEHAKKDDAKKDDHGKKDEKFVYYASVKIPSDAEPGTYKLVGQCAEGELKVAPKEKNDWSAPNGWVNGGDGGSGGANVALATSGAGMLGAAALGGIMLMRRRTNGSLA